MLRLDFVGKHEFILLSWYNNNNHYYYYCCVGNNQDNCINCINKCYYYYTSLRIPGNTNRNAISAVVNVNKMKNIFESIDEDVLLGSRYKGGPPEGRNASNQPDSDDITLRITESN